MAKMIRLWWLSADRQDSMDMGTLADWAEAEFLSEDDATARETVEGMAWEQLEAQGHDGTGALVWEDDAQ